ncbi:MAG: hypothetical protein NC318_11180 [Blautia sp.]|nr:hypothetical protein [Lachnoclostridium sp.]MCM1212155.1 hypothetical protein [Blautia sp.]
MEQSSSLIDENNSLKSEISTLEIENQELLKKLNASTEESTQENELISDTKNNSVSIIEISEFYSDGIQHRKSSITDNIGNSYDGYTFMYPSDGVFVALKGSVVYKSNVQYSRLFGRIIIYEFDKNIEVYGIIKIYGYDILLFDSGVMGRRSKPVDFDLDILSYNEIKIYFKNVDWSSKELRYPHCYLVDTYFSEKDTN